MPFERFYQGSVNRWECDENDHLNVRFYLHKAHQALDAFALARGLSAALPRHVRWLDNLRAHHIRYLREARMAVPMAGDVAVVAYEGKRLTLLCELRHVFTGTVLAAFLSEFDLPPSAHEAARAVLATGVEAVPGHAGARGVEAATSPYASLSLAAAQDAGYRPIGAGVIQPEECDDRGMLNPWHYMGRTSDAMPSFWSQLQTAQELEAGEGYLGGAVLEYRMEIHRPLARGEAYQHFGALGEVGEKTMQLGHLMYEQRTGELVVSAEALSITLDLTTRKSIPIPAARRERMLAHRRQPLPSAPPQTRSNS